MIATRPKRKPYLSEDMALLKEENEQLRRTKDHLEMELAITRRRLKEFEDATQHVAERRLMDHLQKQAQRNGEIR